MRVVSQRQDLSTDFDKTNFRRQEECIYACGNGTQLDFLIGKYATEERAIEVFNDMHFYFKEEMLNMPDVEVYYMPKE